MSFDEPRHSHTNTLTHSHTHVPNTILLWCKTIGAHLLFSCVFFLRSLASFRFLWISCIHVEFCVFTIVILDQSWQYFSFRYACQTQKIKHKKKNIRSMASRHNAEYCDLIEINIMCVIQSGPAWFNLYFHLAIGARERGRRDGVGGDRDDNW